MTQRRRGRPTGPERVPFTTKIRPEAVARLRERSLEIYKTARAVNRVIEEGIMGLAAIRFGETEDVTITVERDDFTAEATATVRLFPRDGEAELEALVWEEGIYMGELTEAELERVFDAAWRKRSES